MQNMQPGDPETQLFNLKSRTSNFELESRVAVSLCLGVRLLIMALFLLLLLGPPTVAAQGGSRVAQVERAAGLLRDGKIEEAERQLAAILKGAPNEAGALNLLGTIRAQKGKLDEAEALFTRAARADRQFVGPRMNLAYLYNLKNLPEKAIAALGEVLSLAPDDADAAQKLARLLLSRNRLDECINLVERFKRRGRASAALLSILGDAQLGKGELTRAEESYGMALGQSPEDPAALLGRAQVALRKGDAQGAVSYLSRAKEAAAGSPDLLYGYALVALRAGFGDEAGEALARAARLRPDDSRIIYLSGVAWLKQRKPDLSEAEQSFRQFLKLQPASPQGQLFLGYVLLKQKRSAEARALLESSVKADASAPEGFYYLGLIAQDEQEDRRAVSILEEVVRRFPSFAHAHVALGVSYMRLKDYERARRELETAVRLSPDDQKAHFNLALLYARLKETGRAQEEMRIVEELRGKADARAEEDDFSASPPPRPQ
jgi:cellulose synthase operon protein C